ncbi:(Fe-S)-binding protein [Streptomyces sp. NPDC091215]|uniref:(Fe-S)-binding protein n=1 Tax=Streptomyces sp. NPDC091215 TaxID=3155192 RepID=UPI00344AE7DE
MNAIFGPGVGRASVQDAVAELCEAAGVGLLVPTDIDGLCCGTPWSSKGFTDGLDVMRSKVRASVERWTRGGELPIISDATSCTEGFLQTFKGSAEYQIVDFLEFVATRILPELPAVKRLESVTLHPTCSSARLGLDEHLARLAEAVAEVVVVPEDWGCCAFAGDRGLLHPELSASATKSEAASVTAAGSQAHASCNRTCEIGMTRATGAEYLHVIQLLAERLPD